MTVSLVQVKNEVERQNKEGVGVVTPMSDACDQIYTFLAKTTPERDLVLVDDVVQERSVRDDSSGLL